MGYGYYDYLEKYYEDYYDYYYEYVYWPQYYGNYNGSNTTYNGTYPPSPYEYVAPYNMEYITPPLFTVSVLCSILSLIITILICYKIYHGKQNKKHKSETNDMTIGLTLFCALMHLAQNTIDPITYYTWYIEYDPVINKELYLAYDTFWCLAKVSLYILFIYRYYLLFTASKTMSGVSKKKKYGIFGCFVMVMVMQCSLYLIYMLLRFELIEYEDPDKGKRIWLNVCWAFLVIDVLLIAILGYLLAASILQLIVNINKMHSKTGINGLQIRLPSTTSGNTLRSKTSKSSTNELDPSINSETGKSTKIESQLTDYMKDNDEKQTEMQSVERSSDDNMKLFLLDYELNDDEILQKITAGRIQLHHLINIDDNDLNELCKSLQLNITQKIRFKSAVKDLQEHHDEPLSVGSMGSMSSMTSGSGGSGGSGDAQTVKYKRRQKDKKKYKSKKNSKLNNLMHTTTKIALTMVVSMISSFIYQFFWLLAYELKDWDMLWMAYTWCIDAVINMLCVYLSMGMAQTHYKAICHDCFRFHQCTLMCIQKIVPESKN